MADKDTEEGSEERDAAAPEETVVPSPNEPTEDEPDFEPFKEHWGDFEGEPGVYVLGKDGLPTQVDQTTESDIAALSLESLVCLEDRSAFVLRDEWGDVVVTLEPKDVTRAPDGRWRIPGDALRDNPDARRALTLGVPAEGDWIEVQPIRPVCKHYAIQSVPYTYNPHEKEQVRLCTARRSTSGAFMKISDTAIWACTLREPRHIESEAAFDKFDDRKIHEGKHRTYLPIKGQDAKPEPPPGGIFSGST